MFTASITDHLTVKGLHGPIEVDVITIYNSLDDVHAEAVVTRSASCEPYNTAVEAILHDAPYTWD